MTLSVISLHFQLFGSERPNSLGWGQKVQTEDSRARFSLQEVFYLACTVFSKFEIVDNIYKSRFPGSLEKNGVDYLATPAHIPTQQQPHQKTEHVSPFH